MSRNHTTLAGLLLFALCLACAAQSPVQFGFGSSDLAPVKFGGKKLPSWLTSDYAPIFNGVNQYASATLSGLNDAEFSVMVWIRNYTVGGKTLSHRIVNGSNWEFYSGNSAALTFYNGGLVNYTVPTIYTWIHNAIVIKDATATWYVNGVYAGALPASTTTTRINGPLGFGGRYNVSQWGNCSLAEVSVWNRALTQSEILRYKDKRLKGTESGLVAYYPLSDNSQTLIDKVGGKNAVASNSITWTRRNGYAAPDVRSERYCLSFDGVDDYASGTNTAITGVPFSYDGWVNVTQTTDNRFTNIFSLASTTSNAVGWFFEVKTSAGLLELRVLRNGGFLSNASWSVPIGRWAHLAFVAETNASGAIFLNGSFLSSFLPGATPAGLTRIDIGSLSGSSSGKGKLANARFWTKSLSQSEIASLMYQTSTGNEPNLVGNFKLTEGSGTVATNSVTTSPGSMTINLISGPTYVGRDIP